jgi:Effector Associated Constant Component 1
MEDQSTNVGISVSAGPGADAEEVAEATLQLRRELLDLDVAAVEVPRAGEPPPGTRGAGLDALGALVVTITQAPVLSGVVAAVQAWLSGSSQRSIKMEIGGDVLELTGLPAAEQRRLTDEWLRRHEGR